MTRQWRIRVALLAALLMVFGLRATSATGQTAGRADAPAAGQVLTWTAGDGITKYGSAPTTAVAGPATIVFENSAATGNTTGMPHTLTFVTNDPEYNSDVQVNILANPNDDMGGRHTAEVTLTPGRYFYHCTIPGHGQMQGVLVVTEGGGGDTTPPETSAQVTGTRNAQGAYVGSATVTIGATDEGGSGVDRIEYVIGDAGAWQPYTAPVVVDQVGSHKIHYRALDKAGNVSADKSAEFTVVAPPSDDTAPADTSATVGGERNADGAYIDMATVTVTASDTGSGVNTIEYAVDAGAWQAYTGPVMVHQVGTHTVRYRATDKAGNVSAEKSVQFTVVAAPPRDTTPPVTGVTVEGTKNSDGAYVGNAKVTVSATDEGGSGVAGVEYSLDGGPYLAYTAPVVVDRVGAHGRVPGERQGGQHLRTADRELHGCGGRRGSRAQLPGVRRAVDGDRGHCRHGRAEPGHEQPVPDQQVDRGREGVDVPRAVPEAREDGPGQAAQGRGHRPARVQHHPEGRPSVRDRQARADRGLPQDLRRQRGVVRQVGAGGRRFVRPERRRVDHQRHQQAGPGHAVVPAAQVRRLLAEAPVV